MFQICENGLNLKAYLVHVNHKAKFILITCNMWISISLQSPDERGVFIQILESAYRFTLGSVSGGNMSTSTL